MTYNQIRRECLLSWYIAAWAWLLKHYDDGSHFSDDPVANNIWLSCFKAWNTYPLIYY